MTTRTITRVEVTAYHGRIPFSGYATFSDGKTYTWFRNVDGVVIFVWRDVHSNRSCQFTSLRLHVALIRLCRDGWSNAPHNPAHDSDSAPVKTGMGAKLVATLRRMVTTERVLTTYAVVGVMFGTIAGAW